ncbi:serine protease inhibitor Kazal-type 5 [Peromyscus californicus insignis]|uniref:serine protease inhibitor Kazal-type 5 n=1 Tax=Peromyscus californicus insignis TaxID=564181 RepID=UPI0022A80588|nr:serine protease inhibitor Kazal-type 5 [Peromyscus californicus insignis]
MGATPAPGGFDYKGVCRKLRALMEINKQLCSEDNEHMPNPNDNNNELCVLCKRILEEEEKSKTSRAGDLSRATRATVPAKIYVSKEYSDFLTFLCLLQLNCEEFKQGRKDGDFACTSDASAVCGTDGKTYRNRCELCAQNEESKNQVDIKSEGECGSSTLEKDVCSDFRAYVQDGRLGCTRENDPVRGPDGRTHGNRCAMCAELFLKEARENATRERESRIRRDAEKELCKEFENQVRSGRLFCTRESDPIRGPDGKMHGNKCALCADVFMRQFSEEKSKAEKKQRDAEERAKAKMEIEKRCSEFRDRANNRTLFCTRENDPIQGLDGKTHGNLCSMCQAFFEAEAEEKKKAEAETRNRRGSEDLETYAKLCDGYRKVRKNGVLYCTRENDPIRGPDGKVHGNTCSMCQALFIQEDKARAKVRREAAKEICSEFRDQAKDGMLMCTRENDPVVGPDGKTHANKCAMCASVFLIEEEEKKKDDQGEKKKVEAGKSKREAIQELCSKYRPQIRNGRLPCPRKNDPIEGLDGKIHKNTCSMCEAFFQQEAKENGPVLRVRAKRDIAKDCSEFLSLLNGGELFCTRENDPVRGPDGKTHGNKCAMCKAFFKKEHEERMRKEEENQRITSGHGSGGGRQKAKEECAQYWESMKKGELSCTRESDPVRGADGKPYNNKCVMCKELLQKEMEEKNKYSASRSNETGSATKKDVCDQFRSQMKNGKLLCTRESDPTRGPDGKTHGNKCAMCKERLEREAAEKKKKEDEDKRNTGKNKNDKEDQCHEFRSMQKDGLLICTRENDPIRGPDGKTHVNKCAMCQSIFEREASERKMRNEENSSPQPENERKDECGEVHNTAEDAKPRQARSSLPSVAGMSEDECSEFRKLMRNNKLLCTQKGDPVHDADGIVYQNKCHMCRDVLEKEALERSELQENPSHIRVTKEEDGPGFSSSSEDSDMCKHYRILPRMGYLCPKNIQPVCGDDGQTYANPCLLCHENLIHQTNTQIRSQGKCEESSNQEAIPAGTPASEKNDAMIGKSHKEKAMP